MLSISSTPNVFHLFRLYSIGPPFTLGRPYVSLPHAHSWSVFHEKLLRANRHIYCPGRYSSHIRTTTVILLGFKGLVLSLPQHEGIVEILHPDQDGLW